MIGNTFAGKPFHDAVPFARELIEVPPERVLWGADFPHPNVKWMLNDGDLVDLFAPFGDDVLRRRILVKPEPTLTGPTRSAPDKRNK